MNEILLFLFAGITAGFLNTAAAGGSLVSFIILWNMGIPALQANIINLIATPASFVGAVVKKKPKFEFKYAIPSGIGTVVGVILLLWISPIVFKTIAPYLIIMAALLLALQPLFKEFTFKSTGLQVLLLFLVGIYAGVFGGAVGTLFLLTLLLTNNYDFHTSNIKKNTIALGTSIIGAIVLLMTAKLSMTIAYLAGGMFVGGYLGIIFAGKVNSTVLRWLVIVISLCCAVWWMLK